MTNLALRTGGPEPDGRGILRIADALLDCHSWACAMQRRYDRLGPVGFRGLPAAALLAGLDGDQGRA
jgi:hypothetical protein